MNKETNYQQSWLEMQELKTKQEIEKEHQNFLDFLYSRIGKEDCKVLNQLGSVAKKLVINEDNLSEDIYVQHIDGLEDDDNSITLGYQITKEEFEELLRKS